MKTDKTYWLCHLSLWLPLLFATPLFVALNNREDVHLSIMALVGLLVLATSVVVSISALLAGLAGERWNRLLSLLLLAVASVLVV